ncbi:hypothetical protein PVAP13_7KG046618 [Panicum virgatum]|uniref:Uncharacterized protein n=1 Tax=Panicum virgatum TaxID=38727 RepID=A0A8T0Q924_PANVG|nr:hypothetical protein PVAP13_7KG046618 [Panicum virgatum]
MRRHSAPLPPGLRCLLPHLLLPLVPPPPTRVFPVTFVPIDCSVVSQACRSMAVPVRNARGFSQP